MRDMVINSSLSLIKKQNPNYDDEKIEVIEYGLVGLYILITKTIVIFTIAAFLNIFIELLLFTIIYNVIRMPSFGMHAGKSWICYIASSIMFIGGTYLCTLLALPINIKLIIGIIGVVFIFKNSPADTEKRPIINSKRRFIYKIISTLIAIIFVIFSILITNNFLANCFLFSLVFQCIVISKITYKLFGQSYDNYKKYIN